MKTTLNIKVEVEKLNAIVDELSPKIYPLIAGLGSEAQGAVLADVVATWIAGHFVAGKDQGTWDLRSGIFQHFLQHVVALVQFKAGEGDAGMFDPFAGKH